MSKIKISNLRPVGSELFYDSEGFLHELKDDEIQIYGGDVPWTDRTWHWTSLVPGSGLIVATAYTTSTKAE
jgi:hypothetical protein